MVLVFQAYLEFLSYLWCVQLSIPIPILLSSSMIFLSVLYFRWEGCMLCLYTSYIGW